MRLTGDRDGQSGCACLARELASLSFVAACHRCILCRSITAACRLPLGPCPVRALAQRLEVPERAQLEIEFSAQPVEVLERHDAADEAADGAVGAAQAGGAGRRVRDAAPAEDAAARNARDGVPEDAQAAHARVVGLERLFHVDLSASLCN